LAFGISLFDLVQVTRVTLLDHEVGEELMAAGIEIEGGMPVATKRDRDVSLHATVT
jgi:hypothetical protein